MNLPSISVVVTDEPDNSKRFTAIAIYDGKILTQVESASQWMLEQIPDQKDFTHTMKKTVAHRLLEHMMGILRA